jgi:hypothetical protein
MSVAPFFFLAEVDGVNVCERGKGTVLWSKAIKGSPK